MSKIMLPYRLLGERLNPPALFIATKRFRRLLPLENFTVAARGIFAAGDSRATI